jgi:hypothetical protein
MCSSSRLGRLVLLLPMIWFSSLLIISVPDKGYSRNESCTLTLDIPVYVFMRHVAVHKPTTIKLIYAAFPLGTHI